MCAGYLGIKHCEGSERRNFFSICVNMGAYHSTKNFRNGDKLYGSSMWKVPENTEIVETPKREQFNRKFREFRYESQMERKFPGIFFRKFGNTPRGCPLFRNLCKFPAIFHSALASSFGCDHNSELDISCKDGAYSIKETLKNLSTYLAVNTSYS